MLVMLCSAPSMQSDRGWRVFMTKQLEYGSAQDRTRLASAVKCYV
jgi:hypothetical protein